VQRGKEGEGSPTVRGGGGKILANLRDKKLEKFETAKGGFAAGTKNTRATLMAESNVRNQKTATERKQGPERI